MSPRSSFSFSRRASRSCSRSASRSDGGASRAASRSGAASFEPPPPPPPPPRDDELLASAAASSLCSSALPRPARVSPPPAPPSSASLSFLLLLLLLSLALPALRFSLSDFSPPPVATAGSFDLEDGPPSGPLEPSGASLPSALLGPVSGSIDDSGWMPLLFFCWSRRLSRVPSFAFAFFVLSSSYSFL